MPKHPIKQVRHHAKKHAKAHEDLKGLLDRGVRSERILALFLGTFVIAIASLIIFFNWGKITQWVEKTESEKKEEIVIQETLSKIKGVELSMQTNYLLDGQIRSEENKRIHNINTQGYFLGGKSTQAFGKKEKIVQSDPVQLLLSSMVLTTQLSHGEHLSSGQNQTTKVLQKSLLTTIYLGKNKLDLNSILEKDAELLSRMQNALDVEVYAYLNQSVNRADSLDNYVSLLQRLENEAMERSTELQSQINFLSASFEGLEESIGLLEEQFFQGLERFNGVQAQEDLSKFIELQKQQAETRATLGAYQGVKNYYDYFLPLLSGHIRAILANRDALVAGVKVTEIENMEITLPELIQEE